MDRENIQRLALALFLVAVAGDVDAIGFLTLGHLFVSFMSGNSTQFAVHIAQGKWDDATLAGSIVGLFVLGVIGGEVLARLSGDWRQPVILICEAAILAAALGGGASMLSAITPLVLAMGFQNAAIHRANGTRVSLTYVTGALVHFGQRLAGALFDRDARWSWLPYVLMWTAMVIGAGIGAFTHDSFGINALFIPIVLLAITALGSAVRIRPK